MKKLSSLSLPLFPIMFLITPPKKEDKINLIKIILNKLDQILVYQTREFDSNYNIKIG